MPANSGRMYKINEELKKEISKIISLELKDPHLTGLISVTKVDTTPDFRYARVYVSMIGCKNNKQCLGILKKSSGYIRTILAKRINLRITPELVFEFDDSLEYGSKIDQILKDITKDMKKEDEE